MTTSDTRLFGFVVTGIVVIGADHCPCALRFGRSGDGAFAFEGLQLPSQIYQRDPAMPLQVSGPDAMPVDGLLRALPALLTGTPAMDDLEYTLLGVTTKPALKQAAFVAAIRLRRGMDEPSEIRIRLVPNTTRSFGFAWEPDWTVDQWLRGLERACRRCLSLAEHSGD